MTNEGSPEGAMCGPWDTEFPMMKRNTSHAHVTKHTKLDIGPSVLNTGHSLLAIGTP